MDDPEEVESNDGSDRADWIRDRLAGFGKGVFSLVPAGFPAYVRLFHPAYEEPGAPNGRQLRWAEVADRAGTTMHALAQFAPLRAVPWSHVNWDLTFPRDGSLEPDALGALCEVLGRHTTTPERCWFCLWEAYGWLHDEPPDGGRVVWRTNVPPPSPPPPPPPPPPPMPDIFRKGSRLQLPGRDYLVFPGTIDTAVELAHAADRTWRGEPQSPNLFWPDDHAWCVATDQDLHSTYIGCSEGAATDLLDDPRLETWPVNASDPISWDSDPINPTRKDVYELLADDVVATLRWSADKAVRFVTRGGRLVGPDILAVAEDVQQRFHDDRIDTTWPACPQHPYHPLRLADQLPAVWTCPTTARPVCALGALASVLPEGKSRTR
jgi:hypothetical protein